MMAQAQRVGRSLETEQAFEEHVRDQRYRTPATQNRPVTFATLLVRDPKTAKSIRRQWERDKAKGLFQPATEPAPVITQSQEALFDGRYGSYVHFLLTNRVKYTSKGGRQVTFPNDTRGDTDEAERIARMYEDKRYGKRRRR